MARPLTEIVPESTHLKVTLVMAVTIVLFLVVAGFRGGAWAEDVMTAKENVNSLTQTVAQLSTAVAQQSMTVSQQSKDTEKILQAIQAQADKQSDDHDRLVRIEAQTAKTR